MPSALPRQVRSRLFARALSIDCGLPCVTVRSAPAFVFSRPAQRSLTLRPVRSPSRLATLSIESSGSFVASAAASIGTGWSEPVPGPEFHPLKSSLSRRTVTPTISLSGTPESSYDAQDEGSAAVHSVTLPSGGGHQMTPSPLLIQHSRPSMPRGG